MSKRFTDTNKWGKPSFDPLSMKMKLVWLYLCDSCNHAGLWDLNMKLMSFQIGKTITIEELKETLKDKIIFISSSKIFIPSFVEFQYGELNEDNRAHKSVINLLKREGLYKGLISSIYDAKDKDKDMVKVKVKDKEPIFKISNEDFEGLYAQYPRKLGKTAGLKKFKMDIKNQDDLENAFVAIKKFKAVMAGQQRPKDLMPYFSTFANTWKDYLDEDIGTGEDFAKNKSASPLGMVAEDAL